MYFGTSYGGAANTPAAATAVARATGAVHSRTSTAASGYAGRAYGSAYAAGPQMARPPPQCLSSSSSSSCPSFVPSSSSSPAVVPLATCSVNPAAPPTSASCASTPLVPTDAVSTSYRPRSQPLPGTRAVPPGRALQLQGQGFVPPLTAGGVRRDIAGSCAAQAQPPKPKNMDFEVVEADLSVSPDDPLYRIKLNFNGRQYVAARHHKKLRGLVDELRTRGYRILRPFPEVHDLVFMGPPSDGAGGLDMIPFYESFGYSIKSLASTVLRSSAAAALRRKCQLEQISRRIDAFLKAVFIDNDDLQFEQQVYNFFWEPLLPPEKKLPPVLEDDTEDEDADEGDPLIPSYL